MTRFRVHLKRLGKPHRSWEVDTATMTRFRIQLCERCGREMVHAFQSNSTGEPQPEGYRICSGCEPAAFDRAVVEAGRSEFLG